MQASQHCRENQLEVEPEGAVVEVVAVEADFVGEYHFVVVFDGIGVAVNTFRGHPRQKFLLVAVLKRRRPGDAWAKLKNLPILPHKSISIAWDNGLCRKR